MQFAQIIAAFNDTPTVIALIVSSILLALSLVFKNEMLLEKVRKKFKYVPKNDIAKAQNGDNEQTPSEVSNTKPSNDTPKKKTVISLEAIHNNIIIEDEMEKQQVRYYNMTKTKMPAKLRYKRKLRSLAVNPFNPKYDREHPANGIVELIQATVLTFLIVYVTFSVLYLNGFIALPIAFCFSIIPYMLLSLKISNNKIRIQERNLSMFLNFTGIYSESSDLSSAFKKASKLYRSDTFQFAVFDTCSANLSSLPLKEVVSYLSNELLADDIINICCKTLIDCETNTPLYKRTFEYILLKYEFIIKSNKRTHMYLDICTKIYLGGLIFAIVVSLIIRYTLLNNFHSIIIDACLFIVFLMYTALGFKITRISDPIPYVLGRYANRRD